MSENEIKQAAMARLRQSIEALDTSPDGKASRSNRIGYRGGAIDIKTQVLALVDQAV